MRRLHYFIRRRPRLLIAVAVAALVGYLAWLLLHPQPKGVIPGEFDHVLFAPDGKSLITARHVDQGADALELLKFGSHWRPRGRGRVRHHQGEKHIQVRIWDEATLFERSSIELPQMEVSQVAYSPDNTRLAILAFETLATEQEGVGRRKSWLRVFQLDTDSPKEELKVSSDEWPTLNMMSELFFASDGRLVGLHCHDGEVRRTLWELSNRIILSDLILPDWSTGKTNLYPIESAPSSAKLARPLEGNWNAVLACCNQDLVLKHGEAKQLPFRIPGPVAFAADGRTFIHASFFGTTIEIWDMKDGSHRSLPFIAGTFWMRGLTVSPDAKFLMATSEPTTTVMEKLRAWLGLRVSTRTDPDAWLLDTQTGQVLGHFPDGHPAYFSPDSKQLAILYSDRVEIWDLPLRSPWLKIVATGLASGLAIFVLSLAPCWLRRKTARQAA